MKDIFSPEDFVIVGAENTYSAMKKTMAKIANEKLNKLIESWPELFMIYDVTSDRFMINQEKHTHKARLAFIEELPKELCKHEPRGFNASGFECKYCGVDIVANWEEKT